MSSKFLSILISFTIIIKISNVFFVSAYIKSRKFTGGNVGIDFGFKGKKMSTKFGKYAKINGKKMLVGKGPKNGGLKAFQAKMAAKKAEMAMHRRQLAMKRNGGKLPAGFKDGG